MTKPQIRNIITKIHFYLLGISLLNFVLKTNIELSLNYRLAYYIILIVYLSGFILFFLNFKPFKKLGWYYSFYIITPIFTLFFFLFGGMLFAILTSLLIYPIYPTEVKAENEKIVVYTKYQDFMGACCPYEVTEKKYWFLEKKIMDLDLFQVIDFKKTKIKSTSENSELIIRYNKYNFETEKSIETDTTIIIKAN
ncbi:MAG: hypothetical protein ACI87N_003548 [Flavobacteriales bacterium]|jgi:hypothetical protein